MPRLLPVTADGVLPANALGSQTWQGAGTADPSVRQANAEASAPLPPKPTPLLDAALKRTMAEEQQKHPATHAETKEAAVAVVSPSQPKKSDRPKPAVPSRTAEPQKVVSPVPKQAGDLGYPRFRIRSCRDTRLKIPPPAGTDRQSKLKKIGHESASQPASGEGAEPGAENAPRPWTGWRPTRQEPPAGHPSRMRW